MLTLVFSVALAANTANADFDGDGKPEAVQAVEGKVLLGKKVLLECGYESLCELEVHDIDGGNPQKELAVCELGPRDDRSCTLYSYKKKAGLAKVPFSGEIYTGKYITNGNGIILTDDWYDRLYQRIEKYTLQNGSYTLTPQPMYAVSATLHVDRTFPILFTAGDESVVVANARPDTEIQVLVEDGKNPHWYLVRLSSGISGWVHLDTLVGASDAYQSVMGAG